MVAFDSRNSLIKKHNCKDQGHDACGSYVEQSKTPKEEQCDCPCQTKENCHCQHLISKDLVIDCLPKTEVQMCIKCGNYPAETAQTWCEFCIGIKTEDTGECECNEELRIKCEKHHFERYGSPSENKLSIAEGRELVKKIQKNKEESMEDRFDKLFMNATLRSNYYDDVKEFIKSEISKAVAYEREENIKIIKKVKREAVYKSTEHLFEKLLSLLNSKKGQE